MKNFYAFLAFVGVVFSACSSDSYGDEGIGGGEEESIIKKLEFVNKAVDIYMGGETRLDLRITTLSGVESYTEANKYGLTWSSSAPLVAKVSEDAVVKGYVGGTVEITVSTSDGKVKATLPVNILRMDNLDRPLESSMIYTSGHQLRDNSVMQSFDLGADGFMYCSQVARGANYNHNLVIVRKKADVASIDSYMELPYWGHGNSICVEPEGADMYVWVGCYGTKKGDGSFIYSQTLARQKYLPNTTLKTSESTEHYYIPSRWNYQASIDLENDILGIWCMNKDYSHRYFYIYRLSEAKSLVPQEKKLSFQITYGGKGDDPEITETPVVKVKDLSALQPLAMIDMPKGSSLTTETGTQGHDIKNGYIYLYEGAGNNNDGKKASTAVVTVIDFKGNLVGRKSVAAIADLSKLTAQGLTSTGYMEPEGIKIFDGILYCGFASKSTDDVRRVAVLQYDLRKN